MNLKIRRFIPVLILLCLAILATVTFSINSVTDIGGKEPRSGFKYGGNSELAPIGDPVPGGGTPCGGNQTSNDTA
ncbi:MAG TPA: hypothetical protein VEH86_00065 [Candidatus Acidoferrum sp.]|nr:hypothetical protein [Candidatus Acidoferrum sp.]